MALGDPYATLPELKERFDIDDDIDDTRLTDALNSSSREIESYCRRQFNKATSATARVFEPRSPRWVYIDDFHTTDDLVIATGSEYGTVWSTTDYRLEPLNGIVSGQSGWPYNRIVGVNRAFSGCGPTLQVTAQWGWPAVPGPVKEACLIMAGESFKLADAPFGVAGFGEFGPVRVRMNSMAEQKLKPYRRNPVLVA